MVVVGPVRGLRARGPAGVVLAVVATVAVVGLHEFQQTDTGADVVRVISEVRADQPLWLSLLRTPVSLFVPAVDLPAWGGLPRLFLAFALAELVFGRIHTLAVAYTVTLAGTLGARAMIALGPGPLGLPADVAHAVDTGASAAIVGLYAYTAVALRAPVLFLAAVVPTVAGSLADPDLAGREHLVAVTVAMGLAAVPRFLRRTGRSVGVRTSDRCQWALTESGTATDRCRPVVPAGRSGPSGRVVQEVGHGDSRRGGTAGGRGDRGDPGR
ncbi:hypothetical protein ACFVYR_14005 [Streptomyces sp. NPDC058284]|uniref:hypothetical protein n=1 Tax=unclassified Streptomyces TaxID=2593676 RepID=UPI00364C7BBE